MMRGTDYSTPSTVPQLIRPTLLRACLAGEYLSLGILCFSVAIGLLWLLFGTASPLAATVMVTGCCWTAFRAVGGLAGDVRAGCVSAFVTAMGLLLWLLPAKNVPAWLVSSWASPAVLALLSAVLFCCDILDQRKADGCHSSPESRR